MRGWNERRLGERAAASRRRGRRWWRRAALPFACVCVLAAIKAAATRGRDMAFSNIANALLFRSYGIGLHLFGV